jgi:hypothetical protein
MYLKKLSIFIVVLIFSTNLLVVQAGLFSDMSNYLAKRGGNVPEFQCTVNINVEMGEDCLAYFLNYKLGSTCQIYTKFNERKGIAQCDSCVNKFLSKTNKKIPKSCLDVKIERTYFSEEEINEIILNKSDSGPAEYGVESGRITHSQGKVFIQRNARLIPAIVGEGLLCGDVLVSDENSKLHYTLNSKEFKIEGVIRVELPRCKEKTKKDSFFGNLWGKIKSKLTDDSFKVKTPTATAGVRG